MHLKILTSPHSESDLRIKIINLKQRFKMSNAIRKPNIILFIRQNENVNVFKMC